MKNFSAETVIWHASAYAGAELLSEISGEAELTAGMLRCSGRHLLRIA